MTNYENQSNNILNLKIDIYFGVHFVFIGKKKKEEIVNFLDMFLYLPRLKLHMGCLH